MKKRPYREYCHEGAHPSVLINNSKYLTTEQYVGVLKRIRKTIESEKLIRDKDDPDCNWGMCSKRQEHYPDPELHIFPNDFDDYGRMSALSCGNDVKCPMRVSDLGGSGCFYDCRVFTRKHKVPTREEALKLYDDAIAGAQK